MLLTVLAAAAAFSTPSADVAIAAAINRAMPDWVDRERKWTAAELEVFSDRDGRVLTCAVRRFVPHEVVASEMCKALIGRKLKPARDFDGDRAFGLGLMIVTVDSDEGTGVGKALGGIQGDGIVLTVNRLPADPTGAPQTKLSLQLEIAPEGTITRCELSKISAEALRKLACEQASTHAFGARTDANGNPVSYVRNFSVEFELAAAT